MGNTLMLVTHESHIAAQVRRIVWLNNGMIEEDRFVRHPQLNSATITRKNFEL